MGVPGSGRPCGAAWRGADHGVLHRAAHGVTRRRSPRPPLLSPVLARPTLHRCATASGNNAGTVNGSTRTPGLFEPPLAPPASRCSPAAPRLPATSTSERLLAIGGQRLLLPRASGCSETPHRSSRCAVSSAAFAAMYRCRKSRDFLRGEQHVQFIVERVALGLQLAGSRLDRR